MGVYSRFGSKDGLLEALFVQGFHVAPGHDHCRPADRMHSRGCGAAASPTVSSPWPIRTCTD